MPCDVGQYLPPEGSPVTEVEHIVHLPMHAFPLVSNPRRTGRRRFVPPSPLELAVDTQPGHSLFLTAHQDTTGHFRADLHHGEILLRSLHSHDWHRNPSPSRALVPGPHMHFPTNTYPLRSGGGSYAYGVEAPRFSDTFDFVSYFCDELDISIDLLQLQLGLGGRP